jgi:diaminopimelate decarboxylase
LVKPAVDHPFVIVDAAMNDLARLALYDAFHRFEAVMPDGERMVVTIAGPVCESGDAFAVACDIDRVRRSNLAVLHATGSYSAAMASTYNCRALSPQVLVDSDRFDIVADRYLPDEAA